MSYFEALGGEARVRAIVDDFLDRVFDDVMIGFFFARVDRARVRQHEYEHAAELLGAEVAYAGRPIGAVHAAHPIRGGHFHRRLSLLARTLDDHGVPPAVREHWLRENEALRTLVTQDAGSDCTVPAPGGAARRAGAGG